jgi:hypothetical protein
MSEQLKERAGEGAQQIQEKASEARQNTRDRVQQEIDMRSSQTGQQMTKTGSALRQTAQQLRGDQQEQQARVLEAVADRTERLGRYLNQTDGEQILRDVERMGRRRRRHGAGFPRGAVHEGVERAPLRGIWERRSTLHTGRPFDGAAQGWRYQCRLTTFAKTICETDRSASC